MDLLKKRKMKRNKIAKKFEIENFCNNLIVLFLIFAATLIHCNISFATSESESKVQEELPLEESDSARYTKKALIQTLNKINARTEQLEIVVGNKIQFGKLDILLHKCWKSPSYEAPENKMLIEIFNRGTSKKVRERIFFGWIFSSSPSISGLEHPIYDITAIKCF